MTNDAAAKNQFQLIAIGCSVGGIEALKQILGDLPPTFAIPIAVVQHRSPDSTSMLVRYFSGVCQLKVREPDDKEPIIAGHVYFAPPNYHLLVGDDKRFNLSVDDAVHYSRPAIDVLFNTAADVYKQRLLGIVMSGANADGAAGLKSIQVNGGYTVVQDPKTAFHRQMPAAAIEACTPNQILELSAIKKLMHGLRNAGTANGVIP